MGKEQRAKASGRVAGVIHRASAKLYHGASKNGNGRSARGEVERQLLFSYAADYRLGRTGWYCHSDKR